MPFWEVSVVVNCFSFILRIITDIMAARQKREQGRKRSSTAHSTDPPREKKGRRTGPFQESIGPVLYDSTSKYKIFLNLIPHSTGLIRVM